MSPPGPDPSVSDKEILSAIRDAYPPAISSSDIADAVDLSQQATSRHLKRLRENGYVADDKVGPARIWWLTDQGRRYLASDDSQ